MRRQNQIGSAFFRWPLGWSLTQVLKALVLVLAVGTLAKGEQQQLSPQKREALEEEYLNAIHPQVVEPATDGVIATGRVILYGQLIDPPYQLSLRGDTLFLNGVRIDPPIMPPWEYKTTQITVTETVQQMSDLTIRIGNQYSQLKEQGTVDLQQELLKYIIEKEITVHSAEWVSSEKLHIVMATGEEFSMRLAEAPPVPNYREVREHLVKSIKDRYEANLMAGDLIVIGYGPILTVPASDVATTLEQIEARKREDSIARLAEILHHKELAREMLFLTSRQPTEEE